MNDKTKEYRQQTFARPPGATEILLVRHGESRAATAESPFPLVNGHGDPELHANGREQARRVAMRLSNEKIGAVYVTNLRRTVETAAPLCAALGITSIVEPDLREVNLGEWEGGALRIHAHQNHPIYQRMIAEQRWDVIPGAESWQQLHDRIMPALKRIKAKHPNELVVAVVHGGVIAHILAYATGARPFAFTGADNGSISHIVMVDDYIVVRRFNEAAHLATDISAPPSPMT